MGGFIHGNRDGKHYWLTPPQLLDELQREFGFDHDALKEIRNRTAIPEELLSAAPAHMSFHEILCLQLAAISTRADTLRLVEAVTLMAEALEKAAKYPLKAEKDDYWGNEDDAYQYGIDVGQGYLGEDAREALARAQELLGRRDG